MSSVIEFPVRRRLRSSVQRSNKVGERVENEIAENNLVKPSLKRISDNESFEENMNFYEGPNEKQRKVKRKLTPCYQKKEISRNSRLNQYQLAKHLLSASSVSCIIGRESECSRLQSLLEEHIKSQKSMSIYISGAPGTGKSVCVGNIVKQLKNVHSFKYIKVNAMNFRNSTALFTHIAGELNVVNHSRKQSVAAIEKHLKQLKQPFLLIVDEIDNLSEKHQEALYTIFDWPTVALKNVIVVGIANTLDFTSRILSRFQLLRYQRIEEIHFTPYTRHQIKQIIQSRLSAFRFKNIIQPLALEMVARKVSSHSGDARKALNLCEKAIEMLEKENLKNDDYLKFTNDDGFNAGSEKVRSEKSQMSSVGISHIMKVLNQVYGSESNKDSCSDISYLPTQQQIIICICLMFSKYRGLKEIELKRFYDVFGKICCQKGVSHEVCNISDFLSMCHLLESKAFLNISQVKNSTKIGLKSDENEISRLVATKPFLSNLVQDSTFVRV